MVKKPMLFPRTFFDVISLIERSTLFPRTFFDVISMTDKSTLFPRTFVDLISMVEKSSLFPGTFFDIISLIERSTLFPRTFFHVILMTEKSTLFPRTFFEVNLMDKNSTSFLASCKLTKTFEEVLLVFITLKCWFFQDDSLYIFQVNLPRVAQFYINLSLTTSIIAKRTVASKFPWYLQTSYSIR